jgi:hypothetical protein
VAVLQPAAAVASGAPAARPSNHPLALQRGRLLDTLEVAQ